MPNQTDLNNNSKIKITFDLCAFSKGALLVLGQQNEFVQLYHWVYLGHEKELVKRNLTTHFIINAQLVNSLL